MDKTTTIRESLLKAISYETYRNLIDKYEAEGKSSGTDQSEDRIHYTALNQKRYKRLDKTIIVADEQADYIRNYPKSVCLLVITESWCADAAQIVPVVHKIAELNPKLTMKLVFRDENDELMNLFLTNGGKAIPMVIFLDLEDKELAHWGSRPSTATQMVADEKAKNGKLTPEFKEELQRWYNNDKGTTIVNDIVRILEEIKDK